MNLDMKFMRDLTNNRKSNSISTRLEGNTSVKCTRLLFGESFRFQYQTNLIRYVPALYSGVQ